MQMIYASRLMKAWEVRKACQDYMAREILKRLEAGKTEA